MHKRILIVLGHPAGDSFCGALARAYRDGAEAAGHTVEWLELGALAFDPVLKRGFRGEQPLEPDLQRAQAQIQAAEHVVWVYPNWWGSPPGLLKGFLDRTFLPGFAFQYHKGPIPKKLLGGRSAHILMTLDTPIWLYRFGMGAPGLRIMKNSVLAFSGLGPIRSTLLGPLRGAPTQRRQRWLERAFALGQRGA